MLEELDIEERDFEADSWSMAVDSSYLQAHRKDVIKRQDVIYGESNISIFFLFLYFFAYLLYILAWQARPYIFLMWVWLAPLAVWAG